MRYWVGLILWILGLSAIISATIWQISLCYQQFGVIFRGVAIPHWSNWLYLGVIPMVAGTFMLKD